MTAPSKQLDQFVVRLPDGMRERIKQSAEKNNRSMNAEIVATLEEKYPRPSTDELVHEFISSLGELLSVYDRATASEEDIAKLKILEEQRDILLRAVKKGSD